MSRPAESEMLAERNSLIEMLSAAVSEHGAECTIDNRHYRLMMILGALSHVAATNILALSHNDPQFAVEQCCKFLDENTKNRIAEARDLFRALSPGADA